MKTANQKTASRKPRSVPTKISASFDPLASSKSTTPVARPQTTITLKSSMDRMQALANLVNVASRTMLAGKSDPATERAIIDAAAEVAIAMKAERIDIIGRQMGAA